MRRCIEDEITRLVDMLDGLDIDPDLEPNLGWTQFLGGTGWQENGQSDDDREDDAGDDREQDDDREPALGWIEGDNQAVASRAGQPWAEEE